MAPLHRSWIISPQSDACELWRRGNMAGLDWVIRWQIDPQIARRLREGAGAVTAGGTTVKLQKKKKLKGGGGGEREIEGKKSLPMVITSQQ